MNDDFQRAAGTLRAHLAQYAQDTRLLRLTTSLGAEQPLVERIEGEEGLSQGFRFQIVALCVDAHLDLNCLLGQPALLEIFVRGKGAVQSDNPAGAQITLESYVKKSLFMAGFHGAANLFSVRPTRLY